MNEITGITIDAGRHTSVSICRRNHQTRQLTSHDYIPTRASLNRLEDTLNSDDRDWQFDDILLSPTWIRIRLYY